MSVVTSSPPPHSTGLLTEEVENISLPLAATEVAHILPSGTKTYKIQMRTNGILQLAFSAATSGTVFFTIFPGQAFCSEGLDSSITHTLYMQSPTLASQTVEIWSGR